MAFNAKNLHYDKQEPSFLRKLKGEFGGFDGRHNVQIARPKKDRLKTGDDDEDDPVIVDEQGERVEKAEYERRVREGDEAEKQNGKDPVKDDEGQKPDEDQSERQKVAEIGSTANLKKRKAARVVGGDDEDREDKADEDSKQKSRKEDDQSQGSSRKKKDPGAAKKKGKNIKLSFDDPDG